MLDLNKFTDEELRTPDLLEKVKKEVEDILIYQEVERARILSEQIELKFNVKLDSKYFPPLEKEYLKLYKILKFECIPISTETELDDLFRYHLAGVLDFENLDILDRLERKFSILSWDYRDKVKGDLIRSLQNNNEQLTSRNIKTEEKELPPTVANWVKDFVRNIGTAGTDKIDNLKKSQYLTNNPNINVLKDEEKKKVGSLLRIYENLKISSLSPEGTDPFITYIDKDGRIKSLEKGQIIDLGVSVISGAAETTPAYKPKTLIKTKYEETEEPDKVDRPISYTKLQETYDNYKIQILAFQGLENKLLEKTQGQLMRLKEELVLALKASDKNQVIAALRILAKQVVLGNILKESPSWQKTIISYIQNKYSAQLSQVELNQLTKNFPRLANTTSVISEFLQYLLKTRLKLSEPESALVGIDLIDILNQKGEKKYVGIVFGNAETGEFEWAKNRIENSELVSELN